jgi:NTE family protein
MSPRVIDCVTLLKMLLPGVMQGDFAALKLPFVAVATDFYAMDQVLLDRGPLIPALAASVALPNWARPVVHDGRVLIDGGYVNPVPFDVVMGRADITVAVDVTGKTHRNNLRRVPSRRAARIGAAQILFQAVTREKLKTAAPHILVRPEVGRFNSLDFFRIRDILEAAQPAKEQLKRELGRQIETSG